MQGLERDDELCRRAVRIGDDVLLAEAHNRIGIHFRDDQRNVLIIPPGRRVIDHHAALRADPGRPLLGDLAAGGHQADVGVGKIVVLERFDFQGLVAERDIHPDAALRGKRDDLADGERPLGKDVQHFAAHVARGACNGDFVTHRKLSG